MMDNCSPAKTAKSLKFLPDIFKFMSLEYKVIVSKSNQPGNSFSFHVTKKNNKSSNIYNIGIEYNVFLLKKKSFYPTTFD